jgi:hypothetical protein
MEKAGQPTTVPLESVERVVFLDRHATVSITQLESM